MPSAQRRCLERHGADSGGPPPDPAKARRVLDTCAELAPHASAKPGRLQRCLARHGVSPSKPPDPQAFQEAAAACGSKTSSKAGPPAAADRFARCLDRNRPAHPSQAALRRLFAKCTRETVG
jgi:hypothetical protein